MTSVTAVSAAAPPTRGTFRSGLDPGLAGSQVTYDAGRWTTQSPMGTVSIDFAPANNFGVLDHDVTLPDGQTVYNPVRVIASGQGSEVVFTLRRGQGTSDADFERDASMVAADLARLKSILEAT